MVRDRITREGDPSRFDPLVEGLTPDSEPGGLAPSKRVFGNFETLARIGSRTAPITNRLLETAPIRTVLDKAVGIAPDRPLPTFARTSLVEWFERRGGPRVTGAQAEREAVLYPDLYTNYVDPARGKAAVRALEALDVRVRVPPVGGSGRAPLSQGMVRTARAKAAAVRDALLPEVQADRDIVVVEPSTLALFRREYDRLLPEDDATRLAGASYDVLEYIYGRLENGADPGRLRGVDPSDPDAALAYHPHCQGRTVGASEYTVAVLDRLGYDIAVSDTECCGMAGSFGYKSEYYDLSMDVGEPLADQFGGTDRRVIAPGTSCAEQLTDLLDRPVAHPVELLVPSN